MAETAKQILDKVRSIKSSDGVKDALIQKNKATLAGAVIGGVLGMYYGYTRKSNMIVTTLMGGLGGALITRVLLPKNE